MSAYRRTILDCDCCGVEYRNGHENAEKAREEAAKDGWHQVTSKFDGSVWKQDRCHECSVCECGHSYAGHSPNESDERRSKCHEGRYLTPECPCRDFKFSVKNTKKHQC